MAACEFCEALGRWLKRPPLAPMFGDDYFCDYRAALMIQLFTTRSRDGSVWHDVFSRQDVNGSGQGYPLNFCPECGRRLRDG